jgi:D(-)-tartrate dehydratase
MAIWDAAAKIAGMPLYRFLAGRLERDVTVSQVPAYASGGYPYPDFATHASVAARYDPPIAAGEALFSAAEAALLDRYAGLRRDRDILLFDPVHCYGLPGYLQIIETLTAVGWPRRAFWPHGGHLFSLHLVAALGLGGAEINPLAFHPFHGPPPALPVNAGRIQPPDVPGIGFELHDDARQAFRSLVT